VDNSSAVIPNAKVSLFRNGEGVPVAVARTNSNGEFHFSVGIGKEFKIVAESEGFLPVETISVTSISNINLPPLTLQVQPRPYTDDTIYPAASTPIPSELSSSLKTTTADPIKTTLCDLEKQANKFHGGYFEVRAVLQGPGLDTPDLMWDAKCHLVFVFFSVHDGRSLDALGDSGRQIAQFFRNGWAVEATVTGQFKMQLWTTGEISFTFSLLSVSDVTKAGPAIHIGPAIHK